ncbi:Protein TolA [Zhongshania aliphaticivorans]|uniref:Protein TolA n=1 Tax=Zhongshania aliphaticivorans TaxID=1470434 RepID=A0A5S9Q4G9_9GAMM|nr:cell envelope integrity protein TolA [Zhongshania aliphaticivorans]CAA0094116.1 Protein TolA [Zhongshania aliphaticivorans]CAA0112206.1 Protein TolA [Zhongshania aliphaticivorans]
MNDFKLVPTAFTVVLHGVAIAFLLLGLPESTQVIKQNEKPLAIQAKLVIEKPVSRPVKPKPKPKPTKKPEVKPEVKPVKKPEPKPEVKPAPTPKPTPKGPTPEEVRKKKAEEKAKAEARQRALEEEIRQQQQKELADALASEDELMDEGELASTYIELIAKLIGQNWTLPPTARNGMKTTVRITTAPSGDIVGHQVVKSSGNPAFDDSATRAITRLGRIEELADLYKENPSVYNSKFKVFNFDFIPTDLRR